MLVLYIFSWLSRITSGFRQLDGQPSGGARGDGASRVLRTRGAEIRGPGGGNGGQRMGTSWKIQGVLVFFLIWCVWFLDRFTRVNHGFVMFFFCTSTLLFSLTKCCVCFSAARMGPSRYVVHQECSSGISSSSVDETCCAYGKTTHKPTIWGWFIAPIYGDFVHCLLVVLLH